jgi:uncharacterized protein (TIGR00369 family)
MSFLSIEEAQSWVAGGYFAPWVAELGLIVERIDDAGVRIRLPYTERIARPGGVVIGQALMSLADTVLVIAFCERMQRRATMATASLTTNFMRPVVRRDVIGEARALKLGRAVNFGEVMMYADGSPEPVGHAVATFGVLPDEAGPFQPAGSHRPGG